MSDPRFARLRTDPRFRRIHKKDAKVVVDDRFASLFDDDTKSKKKQKKGKGRVDKYGRQISETHERDNLRRFYRLEGEEEDGEGEGDEDKVQKPDYARGQALLESSDEEEEDAGKDDESDDGGVVTLRRVEKKHILDDDDAEPEIDLDEDNFADLDAQAEAYAQEHEEEEVSDGSRTRRIAVVNLDWDHVRATHLYKIFSSLVSPTAPAVLSEPAPRPNEQKRGREKGGVARVARGKVLSVRVYPSEFGQERLAREQTEGPPVEVFKKKTGDEEDVRDDTSDVGDAEDYNEEALRKYQLERLRYYYAILECDTVEAASHIYSELEGTELERSANVFDLSFVPDEMTFDGEVRDEATDDINAHYKPVEFVTDALRHSKVKLTWDDDDPERNQLTRRTLTRKEMEENDFRAYLASSSESEAEDDKAGPSKGKGKADRDRLRALLLSGGDDTLPEGWGNGNDGDDDDVDMEITFTPGLSETKSTENETTLEKYKRKMKEKKTKRKEERKEKTGDDDGEKIAGGKGLEDDFFAQGSSDESDAEKEKAPVGKKGKKGKRRDASPSDTEEPRTKTTSTAEELALVAVSDNPNAEAKHFDMKAVLRAEKSKGKKRKSKKGKKGEQEQEPELQEEFAIDVKDDRFKAVHEDHTFAIDPSNPHFKKTKSMSALLEERSKRQKNKYSDLDSTSRPKQSNDDPKNSLKNLVESVKRKSATAAATDRPMGKRRKL